LAAAAGAGISKAEIEEDLDLESTIVNAGAKMHRFAGAKIHQ
jgi:hypothetical protein